ncbi:hypothetical protein TUN205_11134, partial [Pyrenophora tritici-repentis]
MGIPQNISTDVIAATSSTHSNEEVKPKPHKWYYYLWDTLDKPKEERWCQPSGGVSTRMFYYRHSY